MILQRYILRELLLSFFFTFCVVLSVSLLITMFQIFRTFPGLGFAIFLRTLPMVIGVMAAWVILVSSSTSSTLVYARLAAENEITAMRTCGIHTGRIVAPAMLLGLALTAIAHPLNHSIIPWSHHERRNAFRESMGLILRVPPPGNQEFRFGRVRLSYTDYLNGRMDHPTVSQFQGYPQQQLVKEYFAPSGTILANENPIRIVLSKPWGREIDPKGHEIRFAAESDVTIPIELVEGEQKERQKPEIPSEEILDMLSKTRDPAIRNPLLLTLHSRYASSLAPLLLILVSVPIGIRVKSGSRLAGLGAALPPLLLYFVSHFILQGLGERNRIPPLLAAYASAALLAVLAIGLLWSTVRK